MNYKTGLRIVRENMMAGGATGIFGAGGTSPGGLYNSDSYAPGDARIPKVIGAGDNDPYENVDKGKKGKKNKKDRKKLQSKIPIYRRTFVEMLATESVEDCNLGCIIYSEVPEYQQVISDVLEKYAVSYDCDDNSIVFEGSDIYIQFVLEMITNTLSEEVFKTGDVVALLGEMDISVDTQFKRPKKKREEYNQEQLQMGIKVEHEHTNDEKVAALIAMNHLDEFPNYYSGLAKMEKGLKKTSNE